MKNTATSVFHVARDRGAHFHKCDFQVHTPRDAMWSGEYSGAASDEDRKVFARALIVDARSKGLDALAITDHHDLGLWRHVQEAAVEAAIHSGTRAIVVFPGVELTLSNPPCQALLLFDPTLSDIALNQIWGALGVTPIPTDEPSCGHPTPLRRDLDFDGIYRALSGLIANPEEVDVSKRSTFASRFILLPHVHDHGHQTLLRRGQHKTYAEMPCVGGYIEGCFYFDLNLGTREKLEGRTREWGNKAIGVFQTSDSRSARRSGPNTEFSSLGVWPTWVKWTTPSAEALRQACLARDSRISHTEPVFPQLRILGVEVSDSTFLGPCSLWLNPQFTSFIGGRGTGKSTLLEYIRWGLCDDPLLPGGGIPISDELPDFQKRRKSLIEKTLGTRNGYVTVYYEKFGVPYRITRLSSETIERVTVTQSDGTSTVLRGDQVRKEFPIIAYAQKQLSIVGTLPEEVRRLVTDPVREKVANLDREIVETALPALRTARQRWLRHHQLHAHVREALQDLSSKKNQADSLRSGLTNVSTEDNAVIASHEQFSAESAWIEAVETSIDGAQSALARAGQMVDAKLRYHPHTIDWPNPDPISRIALGVDALRNSVGAQIQAALADLRDFTQRTVQPEIGLIRATHEQHNTAYRESLARSSNNERELNTIRALEEEILRIERLIRSYNDEIETLATMTAAESPDPMERWFALHAERLEVLATQAALLSENADNAFRVSVKTCGDPAPVRAKLQLIVNCGKNIRGADEKVRYLSDLITAAPAPLEKWVEVVDDFRTLVESRGATTLPSTKYLESAGFSHTNLGSLRDGIDLQLLEDVRYVPLQDEIIFEFAFGKNADGTARYIPFQDASPGQQATVLLKALLGQQGPPLLIDQPEEDLDNEQVNVIAESIRRTKHHRQLVFVSHNANLVVNGDAELVACFGYRKHGDQTAATVTQEGSIDFAPVREIVTSVMEGGRDAFNLRRQKYNF